MRDGQDGRVRLRPRAQQTYMKDAGQGAVLSAMARKGGRGHRAILIATSPLPSPIFVDGEMGIRIVDGAGVDGIVDADDGSR